MEPQNANHIINIKKLVSNAKAIISNQIALPLGIRKMAKLKFWFGESVSLLNIDLTIFDKFENEVNGLPIGSERLLWEKEALKKQDIVLENIIAKYREEIIDKCFQIIEVLDEH